MNYKKLIKCLLLSIAISFAYGETCKEIDAYAKYNEINLKCFKSSKDNLIVTIEEFLNVETKKNFLSEFLKQFPNVESLDIFNKDITGELIIPENSNLRELNIAHNELTGKLIIPENSKLEKLDARNNNLTGNIIIPKNCNLEYLYVSNNKFKGTIVIPENCNIKELDISHNELKGDITLTKNSKLRFLNTNGNDIQVLSNSKIYENHDHIYKKKIKTKKQQNYMLILYRIALVSGIIILGILFKRLNDKIKFEKNSFIPGECYIAGSNYVPCKKDELAISVSDRIEIIKMHTYGKAYGKNITTKQFGVFPLHCLNNKKTESLKSLTKNSFIAGKCYKAASNNVSNKEEELAISVDDPIEIIEMFTNNSRAFGKNITTEQIGVFPLCCLKKNEETESLNSSTQNSFIAGECYTAGSNNVSNKEGELEISVNDRIKIIELFTNNSKAFGKNVTTKQIGVFPLHCLNNKVIRVQNKKTGSYKTSIIDMGESILFIFAIPGTIITIGILILGIFYFSLLGFFLIIYFLTGGD